MTASEPVQKNSDNNKIKERQFKGLSLSERKQLRREKLIEAGIEAYGTCLLYTSPSPRDS